jgi:hypothetical protein
MLRPTKHTRVLNQISSSPSLHGFEHPFAIFLNREHDDLGLGKQCAKPGDARDAVAAREMNIH